MTTASTVPVTVAIPCFGGGDRLLHTLAQISRCDPLPAEVLILADGGWEPDVSALPSVRVLRSAERIGPGGGRQAGIRAASCDLVASFDNDSWPSCPDYFAKAVALMEAFPDAAVLSPAVSLPDWPGYEPSAEVWESRSYEGCASIHRRSLHLQLPGFVPVASAYGLEEADIALQARTHGMKVLASSWLTAWHDRPRSEDAHGVTAWIRNELVLGWLRYPLVLQPWSWWRAFKRFVRDRGKVPASTLLRSVLSAPALCAESKQHQARASIAALMQHHRGPLAAWRLAGDVSNLTAQRMPKARRALFIQFTDPAGYPPLEHSSRILAREGWSVRFVGLRAGTLELPPHPRIECVSRARVSGGLRTKLQFLRWTLTCVFHAWKWRAEMVYCSDPFAALPGLIIQCLFGRMVIYHEHDSPPDGRSGGFQTAMEWCRRKIGRKADVVVLPSEARMRQFQEKTATQGRCIVVWNTPSHDEVLPVPRQPLAHGLRVVFHGSIVPERFPMAYVEVLAKCPEQVTMDVIGYETAGSLGYKQQLAERAAALGLGGRFSCLPPMQRRALLRCCATYDVGLALLARREWDSNSIHMAGASNKPFDYASQGVAVIVPDEPEWRKLYVENGCGVACDPSDIDALAKLLTWMLHHPAELRAMGEAGRVLCLEAWHYEKQFAPVLSLLAGNEDVKKLPLI